MNSRPSLTLRIENVDQLPDGGPTSITIAGQRGLDFGRDPSLDWTLPDPTRVVSSRHAEVRYREGGYWLTDISTNGTCLHGTGMRLSAPHLLRDGDRFDVGPYIIAVSVSNGTAAAPAASPVQMPHGELGDPWGFDAPPAPPADPDYLRPPKPAVQQADMLDWYVDIPPPQSTEPPVDDWVAAARAAPARPQLRPGAAPDQAAEPVAFAEPLPRVATTPPDAIEPQREAGLPPAVGLSLPVAPAPVSAPPQMPPQPVPEARPVERPAAGFVVGPAAAAAVTAQAPVANRDLIAVIARGAGLPPEMFAGRTPEETAELIGVVLRLMTEHLQQMLTARAETKGLVRSTNQTMIQAVENNPLKFQPTPEDALRTMFGPPTRSYLDARRAVDQAFRDLKSHQLNTYAAMQQGVMALVKDLDPGELDAQTEKETGLGAMIGSRKAKLWDLYVARWKAKTERHDNGLLDAFMLYFSEAYERLSARLRS